MSDEIVNAVKSGEYIGNGTTQDIIVPSGWTELTITREDRAFIMTFFKGGNADTVGGMSVGAGDNYRRVTVIEGGVSENDDGFTVGDHISVNENGEKYFWKVS